MEQEIATALAHEIKNPAAVALAHVNLLRAGSEDMPHHLGHIEQALGEICGLVQEMLTAAYAPADACEVDFFEILSEVLETYRAAWPGISFSLQTASGVEALPCLGQEASLRMVFSNLLKNAVEAVEAAEVVGKIEISAAYNEGGERSLEITICDNGSFNNPAQKPHGNGLGLAICRHLAGAMGAKLSVSPGKNGGGRAVISVAAPVTNCPIFA